MGLNNPALVAGDLTHARFAFACGSGRVALEPRWSWAGGMVDGRRQLHVMCERDVGLFSLVQQSWRCSSRGECALGPGGGAYAGRLPRSPDLLLDTQWVQGRDTVRECYFAPGEPGIGFDNEVYSRSFGPATPSATRPRSPTATDPTPNGGSTSRSQQPAPNWQRHRPGTHGQSHRTRTSCGIDEGHL